MLDDMRREFADFLANDPAGRWRMDAALAHVVALAYRAGLADGRPDAASTPSAKVSGAGTAAAGLPGCRSSQ